MKITNSQLAPSNPPLDTRLPLSYLDGLGAKGHTTLPEAITKYGSSDLEARHSPKWRRRKCKLISNWSRTRGRLPIHFGLARRVKKLDFRKGPTLFWSSDNLYKRDCKLKESFVFVILRNKLSNSLYFRSWFDLSARARAKAALFITLSYNKPLS